MASFTYFLLVHITSSGVGDEFLFLHNKTFMFSLKGKHNDCLGNGNLMIYKIRFKKSNTFGSPLPHSASTGQDRGYLQRGSQDLSTQKQASEFSFLHIDSFTTGLITSMNLADER